MKSNTLCSIRRILLKAVGRSSFSLRDLMMISSQLEYDYISQARKLLPTGIDPDKVYDAITKPSGPGAQTLDKVRSTLGDKYTNNLMNLGLRHSAMLAQKLMAWDKYQALAGEVEARNAAERWAQGDYVNHPHNTLGYGPPPAQQLVRMNYGSPGSGQIPTSATIRLSPVDHDPFSESP